MPQAKTINIDPADMGRVLSQRVFGPFAARGKLPESNDWGISIKYGMENSPEQGKLLITFVTHDDIRVQISFSVQRFVIEQNDYLDMLVTDMKEMLEQKRKERSPLIIRDPGISVVSSVSAAVKRAILH